MAHHDNSRYTGKLQAQKRENGAAHPVKNELAARQLQREKTSGALREIDARAREKQSRDESVDLQADQASSPQPAPSWRAAAGKIGGMLKRSAVASAAEATPQVKAPPPIVENYPMTELSPELLARCGFRLENDEKGQVRLRVKVPLTGANTIEEALQAKRWEQDSSTQGYARESASNEEYTYFYITGDHHVASLLEELGVAKVRLGKSHSFKSTDGFELALHARGLHLGSDEGKTGGEKTR